MAVKHPRRVLIISRDAPPTAGPPSIRVAKLVKFLPEFQWTPTIITVPIDHSWALDPSLVGDMAGVDVFRVSRLLSGIAHPTTGPAGRRLDKSGGQVEGAVVRRGISRMRREVASHLLFPDSNILWVSPATRRATSLAHDFDAVLTTAPPFSTHLAGYWLATRHNLPWVADYRDNWTMNPLFRRGRVPQWMNEKLEGKMLARADAIDVVSKAAADQMVTSFGVARDRLVVAGNGYDPDDLPAPSPHSQEFEFAYTGTLNHSRDPRPFCRGVLEAARRRPELLGHFRLRLIGNMHPGVVEDVTELLGSEKVVPEGMLTHREALLRASPAAALLLITTVAEAGNAGLTSKIFEYLGLRRPILAIVPAGPARDLINRLQAGYCCDPNNTDEIASAVLRLYDDWVAGRSRTVRQEDLQPYTRRATAESVAQALDLAVRNARHR